MPMEKNARPNRPAWFAIALAATMAASASAQVPGVAGSSPLAPNGERAFSDGPGLPTIHSEFTASQGLIPSWGSGKLADPGPADDVGAFRFICSPGHLLADDPIVYPGQPGKSHLHQFFGNLGATASSTYATLRRSGKSSCNEGDSPLNRSAYWMPAMLDGAGNVVRPDYISIYYKRRPVSDPKCSLTSGDPRAEGNCVPLPNGLRFIFGFNMLDPKSAPTGAYFFDCDGPTAKPGHYATLPEAASNCPATPGPDGKRNRLGAVITAPPCWDGRNLDSPDHRSHVAYSVLNGHLGKWMCPKTHPYVIPDFTLGAWFTVDENVGRWRLSSDDMIPGSVGGSTFHADWWGAWDEQAEKLWMDNCINKRLTCAGGDTGGGMQLEGAAVPSYGWGVNPERLVPLAEVSRTGHAHPQQASAQP